MDVSEATAKGAPCSAWFSRQLGLITKEQAVTAGLSGREIRWRLQQGRWALVAPGLYRLVGAPMAWEQRALAACLLAGREAVLSHGAAAAALGLAGMAKGPIEVSVPDRRRALAAGRLAIVHRPGRLDRVDRARVGVLPVTTPTRTVIDLSACLPVPALERLVDDTLSRRRTSLAKLERRADEILGQGRPGSAALRAVLEGWAPGRPADSLQEMRLVRLLLRHGLPEPVRQHRVCDGDRFVARVDLAWPRARVALELDSAERHAGPRAFHRDRARALRIEAAGWGLYSITPRNIDEGAMTDLVVALRATLGLPAPVRQRPTPIPTVGPSPEAQAGCR